ncbi:MAG: ATP synthase F0 subunit B [Ruminococcaceae bacterium]|nr:ATP synthase F0 subunit B [Oscillospiraceae bacterium]
MSFQPSVIIWTVICFLLLTVILKNLLFTPVLRVLDERKERLEAARGKRAEIERLTAENEALVAAEKEKELQKRSDEAKQLAFDIQSEGKKEIELAQRQCLAEIEKYRESIKDEHEQIVASVAPKMETAAAIFAKNIITHRI